ncbi:hypothetical protein LEN26_007383 [Aphanomyces euteiches]|nr:hypothetical protein LEN26_007383 [Aphanomyces euteiches]
MSNDHAVTKTLTNNADICVVVPPAVEEEVFEIQVLHPYKLPLGWRPASHPWRNRAGDEPDTAFCKFPPSFDPTSASDSMVDGMKDVWRWSTPWTVDTTYTLCDEEGWTYGISIASLNNHIAEGTSKTKPRPFDFLRRRRWIRTRIKVQPAEYDDETDSRSYCVLRLDSALAHVVYGRATPLRQMLNLKFNPKEIAMEGWLGKFGHFSHNWRLRYFLLRRDTNTLIYLKDTSSMLQLGQVPITTHTTIEAVAPLTNKTRLQFAFELVNGNHRCRLNAPSEAVKQQWINAIHDIMFKRQPPFALKVSTSQRLRPNYRAECVLPHLTALQDLFTTASAFILSVFDDLFNYGADLSESNAKIQSILKPLSTSPSSAVSTFRAEVVASLDAISAQHIQPLRNLALLSFLKTLQAKEAVYDECMSLLDSIWSYQPPESKAVVNLRRTSSDRRRQALPEMWLQQEDRPQRPSITDNSSEPCSEEATTSDRSLTDVAVLGPKGGRKSSKQSLRRVFGRPEHLERGVDGIIIWANDKDIGSLVAYTLTSKMYVERLEDRCKAINVLMELEDKMIARSRNIYKEIRSKAIHHLKCHVVLNSRTDENDSRESEVDEDEADCTTVTVYFAPQFHCLRHVLQPGNLGYLDSIAQSASWETTGGKSGAFFLLTHDRQFVLKGVTATEFNMFVDLAPSYFDYMASVAENKKPSCLAKILGAYKIKLHGHSKAMYVFAMECSTFGFTTTQMYDLKGVKRNRDVEQPSARRAVLPDENFIDRVPVQVRENDWRRFSMALENDVKFLASCGVIDYSLLLAFNDETLEIRAALIDYVHQFDFLKRVESGAKKMYQLPTVIPPEPYMERFLKAMEKYFLSRQVDEDDDEEAVVTRCLSDTVLQSPSKRIRPRMLSDGSSRRLLKAIGE